MKYPLGYSSESLYRQQELKGIAHPPVLRRISVASRRIGLVGWYLADGYSAGKAWVLLPKSLEITRSNSTWTPLWSKSNKGKRPPEKPEALDQRKC